MKSRTQYRSLGYAAGLIASLAGAGVWMSAAAQSLSDLRARDAEEAALAREIAYAAELCASELRGTIDWSSARNWPVGESLARACDGALGALEAVCRAPGGQNRAARVTRFVCAGDGSGASFRNGRLRYGARAGQNGYAQTKALLDRAL